MLRACLVMFVGWTLLTGVVYPLTVSWIAWAAFPEEAAGSVVVRDGRAVGSALVGQAFSSEKYFWPRPSATGPNPYNAAASSSSNLGPTNPALLDAVQERVASLRRAHPDANEPVPVDLATASGSGLDPHISPAAAYYQADRVRRARGLAREQVDELIAQHTEPRTAGFLGEPRVNVLRLNLALDQLAPSRAP